MIFGVLTHRGYMSNILKLSYIKCVGFTVVASSPVDLTSCTRYRVVRMTNDFFLNLKLFALILHSCLNYTPYSTPGPRSAQLASFAFWWHICRRLYESYQETISSVIIIVYKLMHLRKYARVHMYRHFCALTPIISNE